MDLMDYRRQIIASSPHLSHAEGAVATFADGTDLPLKSLIVDIEPVQSGSGDPSPTNVRPISGWDAIGVHDSGINVWDEEWDVGSIDSNTGTIINGSYLRTKNLIPVVSGQSYYFKCATNHTLWVYGYDVYGNFLKNAFTSSGYVAKSFNASPLEIPANVGYIRFLVNTTYGTTYNHDISINYPSTDHDYHPYTGTLITVQLGRTVYGGTLNVLTGELVVDRVGVKIADLAVSMSFRNGTATSFKRFVLSQLATSVAYTQKHGAISSFGKEGTAYYGSNRSNDTGSKSVNFAITTDGGALAIYDPDLTLTNETFMAKYGDQIVVYPLATPQTYHLDPQTVRSLAGQNNIFADTGNVALEYWAHQ